MYEAPVVSKPEKRLRKGVKPIFACIGTPEAFRAQSLDGASKILYRKLKNALHVDYKGNPDILRRENFMNAGPNTYVISPLDNRDKFSGNFWNCTGIIVTGIEKSTGENISFMSHQDPTSFLNDEYTLFTGSLKKILLEVKEKCIPNTIDAVIIGGDYPIVDKEKESHAHTAKRQNYIDSIEEIKKQVKQVLEFEPTVVNGPKTYQKGEVGADQAFYDNTERRLYFLRASIDKHINDFPAGETDKVKDNWKSRDEKSS